MKKLLFVLILAGLVDQAAGQTGSPVYLTRGVTITSGAITVSGPITAVIGNQPITVLEGAPVTVIQGGPVTIGGQPVTVTGNGAGGAVTVQGNGPSGVLLVTNVGTSPVLVANQPVTVTNVQGTPFIVQFTATPSVQIVGTVTVQESSPVTVVSPVTVWGTVEASAAGSVTSATAPATMIQAGAEYNLTQPTLTTGQSAAIQMDSRGAMLTWLSNGATKMGSNPNNVDGVAGASGLDTSAVNYLLSGANNLNRIREVDAVSNTNTALGVVSVGFPDFTNGPTTYTATGAVTFGPFIPSASKHQFYYTTTGTITAAAVTWFSSPDGVKLDATNGVLASNILTTFSGSYVKPVSAIAARYIIQQVTITTLGGTNIITGEIDGE